MGVSRADKPRAARAVAKPPVAQRSRQTAPQPARSPNLLQLEQPPNRPHQRGCQTARNQRDCQASRRSATVKPLILQRSLSQNVPTTHRGSRLFKLFARFVPNCAKNFWFWEYLNFPLSSETVPQLLPYSEIVR